MCRANFRSRRLSCPLRTLTHLLARSKTFWLVDWQTDADQKNNCKDGKVSRDKCDEDDGCVRLVLSMNKHSMHTQKRFYSLFTIQLQAKWLTGCVQFVIKTSININNFMARVTQTCVTNYFDCQKRKGEELSVSPFPPMHRA